MTRARLRTTTALLAGLLVLGGLVIVLIYGRPSTSPPSVSAVANLDSAASNTKETLPSPWSRLTQEQQLALAPLAQIWSSLPESYQSTWLALSRNFAQMTSQEQATLQSRMREWASLTPRQRSMARLNFADVKQQLGQDEKRARWEAYQALSAEEKSRLAREKPKTLVGAAPAIRPTPTEKLVTPPQASANKTLPRIDTDQVAPVTLLPSTTVSTNTPASSTATPPVVDATTAQ